MILIGPFDSAKADSGESRWLRRSQGLLTGLIWGVEQWLARQAHNLEVAGSIPAAPIPAQAG